MSQPGSGPQPVVAVAVLTFRRPQLLAELLPELIRQAATLEGRATGDASVVVIDNDSARSAEALVQACAPAAHYVCEPTAGISAARARAVREARDADLLVFIDDDVWPERADWLRTLVSAWHEHGRPAGVVGRVTPTWIGSIDPWIAAGGFFVRPARTTGDEVPAASSANLLIDLRVLRRMGVTFDSQLGLRGGEDTQLTSTLVRAGQRLVWCAEAGVLDPVPAERMTRKWVLRRAYSHGMVTSRNELFHQGVSVGLRCRLIARGVGRVVNGAVMRLLGLSTGRLALRARGSRLMRRGAGMVAGAIGNDYIEYERTPAGQLRRSTRS